MIFEELDAQLLALNDEDEDLDGEKSLGKEECASAVGNGGDSGKKNVREKVKVVNLLDDVTNDEEYAKLVKQAVEKVEADKIESKKGKDEGASKKKEMAEKERKKRSHKIGKRRRNFDQTHESKSAVVVVNMSSKNATSSSSSSVKRWRRMSDAEHCAWFKKLSNRTVNSVQEREKQNTFLFSDEIDYLIMMLQVEGDISTRVFFF